MDFARVSLGQTVEKKHRVNGRGQEQEDSWTSCYPFMRTEQRSFDSSDHPSRMNRTALAVSLPKAAFKGWNMRNWWQVESICALDTRPFNHHGDTKRTSTVVQRVSRHLPEVQEALRRTGMWSFSMQFCRDSRIPPVTCCSTSYSQPPSYEYRQSKGLISGFSSERGRMSLGNGQTV